MPYRKVMDPIAEGNPAPIVNPNCERVPCVECGFDTDAADALHTDCWMARHDARFFPVTDAGADENGAADTDVPSR